MTAAEAALVTVPLGVLKKGSINFQPPLPSRKQEAIDRMGFGILNKARNFGHLLFRDKVSVRCPAECICVLVLP